MNVELDKTGELQVWALLFAIKSCHLLCKYWNKVCKILLGCTEMQPALCWRITERCGTTLWHNVCQNNPHTTENQATDLMVGTTSEQHTGFTSSVLHQSFLRFWNALDHFSCKAKNVPSSVTSEKGLISLCSDKEESEKHVSLKKPFLCLWIS